MSWIIGIIILDTHKSNVMRYLLQVQLIVCESLHLHYFDCRNSPFK